jgi:hypothetical protein
MWNDCHWRYATELQTQNPTPLKAKASLHIYQGKREKQNSKTIRAHLGTCIGHKMISFFKNYSVIHSTVNEQMQKYKPTAQEKYLAQGFFFFGDREIEIWGRD